MKIFGIERIWFFLWKLEIVWLVVCKGCVVLKLLLIVIVFEFSVIVVVKVLNIDFILKMLFVV